MFCRISQQDQTKTPQKAQTGWKPHLAPYTSHGELSALFRHWESPQDKVMALSSKLFHDKKIIFTHIIKEAETRFLIVSMHRKAWQDTNSSQESSYLNCPLLTETFEKKNTRKHQTSTVPSKNKTACYLPLKKAHFAWSLESKASFGFMGITSWFHQCGVLMVMSVSLQVLIKQVLSMD